ncbi:aldo/keto reductase [Intrasporangium chromatireducens Q5-1]|uniref:Aldo/keto reductase n=1 Tax=Intrasporangium chromatireducens Q5-1 TaxID=584657 RepID=W9GNZ2_9MICO|nr:aldo/keto reductase [Intrasporangium chromatireducens]EWT07860.1 aldo/keto reductase [Intrasporangium chromatireducens Q5-1]
MTTLPTVPLNDTTRLPIVGFGTYPMKGEQAVAAVGSALELGYRLLDTAVNYGNEEEVGEAVRRAAVRREEVRVQTKLPGRHHAYDLALGSLRDSARRLGVEQLDVALVHWPNPRQGRYVDAWRALVRAQQDGLVRTVGVSNFTEEHLSNIIDATGVVPAVNQIELHPWFPQEQLRQVHNRLGIRTQAWSPLGKRRAPFDEPAVADAAREHGVSPAQVILRWHVQLGSLPLPKSATRERQRTNLEVLGFELTDEQMRAITALGRPDGRLFGGDPDTHEEI